MARNLLRAGYELTVLDINQDAVNDLVAQGAQARGSPAALASQSDIVIMMLPDTPQVAEVVLGKDGVLAGAPRGMLLIDMSTVAPAFARELVGIAGPCGVGVLDAPVSGGDIGAIEGTLSIMAGGNVTDFERAQPVFAVLGKTVVHVGPPGAGQTVKACNQIVVGITYAAVSEALVLGSKLGVDPSLILDVLSGGLAANRVMTVRRRNFLEHDFQPGFKVDLHHKDLAIALGAGSDASVPLPFTALVQQAFEELRAHGQGNLDHSALLTIVEKAANHQIGASTHDLPPGSPN
jgi:2-hydroxy-3-oxopropionate reductase